MTVRIKLESGKQVETNQWTLQRLRRIKRQRRLDAMLDFLASDTMACLIVVGFFVMIFLLMF